MINILKYLHKHNFGKFAEIITRIILRLRLYSIIKTRYKNSFGEIDIIAKKRNMIIFIEVKARRLDNIDDLIVSNKQKKRIVMAAQKFISYNKKYQNFKFRYDLVIFNKYLFAKYIPNAWDNTVI